MSYIKCWKHSLKVRKSDIKWWFNFSQGSELFLLKNNEICAYIKKCTKKKKKKLKM